jgi:serine protease Do
MPAIVNRTLTSPRRWAAALACATVAAGCDPRPAVAPAVAQPAASAPAGQPAPTARPATGAPDFTVLMRSVGPAVVNVTTLRTIQGDGSWPGAPGDPLFEFFRRFMPAPPQQGGERREFRREGVGSGFLIGDDGLILTNAHVVADADEVKVRLADSKREYVAKVLGSDAQTDVAVLKVEAQGLPAVRIGDSGQLLPGQWVAAIGSPFGLANTITAGIVSATERALPHETYVPFIQTDVAVNPGNSGGPLINTQGEVVGINSMIYSGTGGYMGVSFAIPIHVAMDIAAQLRTQGHVTRGRLGIGIQQVSVQLAESFRLGEPRGALVTSVEPGSAAQKAGLAVGDVLLRFAGQPVREAHDLPRMVAGTKPGTQVPVEVWRDGQARTLDVTVGESAAPTASARPASAPASAQKAGNRLGLQLSELSPADQRRLGEGYALRVERVDDPASGLRPGDLILAVNQQRFRSLADFNTLVAKAEPGGTLALLVRRGEGTQYVAVPVKKTGE